jgi:hypothetical protein
MMLRNPVTQNFVYDASMRTGPVLHLALNWSSPMARILRTSSMVNSPFTFVDRTVVEQGSAAAGNDVEVLATLQEEKIQSKALLREIVERTRRIEERVRVDKKLAAKSAAPEAVSAESQELRRRTGPDWWKSEPAEQTRRAAATPAVNVDQIAESVMRRLDNRVSAWRERMGRI